jgi:hypothetical protein
MFGLVDEKLPLICFQKRYDAVVIWVFLNPEKMSDTLHHTHTGWWSAKPSE